MKYLDLLFNSLIDNLPIIINLGSQVFLVYMLLRILSDQDKTYKEIRSGTNDLIEAGKKLNRMFSIAERLAERNLNEKVTISKTDESNSPFEQQLEASLKKIEQLISQAFAVVENVAELPPSDIPRWRDSNMQSMQKIMADQQLLRPEIAKIQDILYRLSKEIRRGPATGVADTELPNEQEQTIKSYQEMLIKTRERAKSAESKANLLQSEIDLLNKKNNEMTAQSLEELNALKDEIKKINDERTSLIRNMDALTNEILRTKIEKNFIEDRFIELS